MSKVFFTENAYNVLGLDSSVSDKEILKRSREIENLLKIDEVPEYDLDLPFSKDVRTGAKVKKAAEKLMSPDKKITETFFWLFIKDSIDEKALKLFREGNYIGSLEILQEKIATSPNNFTAIRNKAVLESLIFTEKAQNKYLEASLKSWQAILGSDKQWVDFKKVYKLNNPDASDALFVGLKRNAEKTLSGFYESMSKAEDKPEIYAAFSKRFSVCSDTLLDPLLNKLNDITRIIDKYDIEFEKVSYAEGDRCLSEESEGVIKKFKSESSDITNEMRAFGEKIWNSSKAKITRDKNAKALRSIAVKISHNSNLVKYPEDKELLDELLVVAYDTCSDGSLIKKEIEGDQKNSKELDEALRKIRKNNENVNKAKKEMSKINSYIQTHNFDAAIKVIDKCLGYELGAEDVVFLKDLRAKCVMAADKKDVESATAAFWFVVIIIIIILMIIGNNS